jgi:hypothetical protein
MKGKSGKFLLVKEKMSVLYTAAVKRALSPD